MTDANTAAAAPAASRYVYVTFIRTTPEALWAALTSPETLKLYWFDMTQQSDWTAGSPWRLLFADGRVADSGEILEADPPRRLVFRWRNEFRPELRAEGDLEAEAADRIASGQMTEARQEMDWEAFWALPSPNVPIEAINEAIAWAKGDR